MVSAVRSDGAAPPQVRRGGYRTPDGYVFELSGGNLALDFSNTLDLRGTDSPRELLVSYDDLVGWSRQAGALSQAEAEGMRTLAASRPRAALSVLQRARDLREVLFEMCAAVASGAVPPERTISALNDTLSETGLHVAFEFTHQRFEWGWVEKRSLDRMLWPVGRSAADLLTSPDIARVRRCAGDTCGWLFIDRSKNGSRRWCDMTVCGNRNKVRRFRAAHGRA